MSNKEILDEIMKLEDQIKNIPSLSSIQEIQFSLACREKIAFLKEKLKVAA